MAELDIPPKDEKVWGEVGMVAEGKGMNKWVMQQEKSNIPLLPPKA